MKQLSIEKSLNSDIPATVKNSYLPVESIFGKRTYPTHRKISLEM